MFYIKNVILFIIVLFIWQPLQLKAQAYTDLNNFTKRKEQAIAELKKNTKSDTARVNMLLSILNTAVFLKEKKEVMPFLPEALEISRKLNYKRGLGNCYLQNASYYKSSSDYANALAYYDSALYITADVQNEEMLSIKEYALEQKGIIYYSQGNYYTALDFLFESLKYISRDKEERKIRIYTFITEIYTHLNNLEKAAEYAQINIRIVEKDSSIVKRTSVYFSFIDVCIERNDLKTATAFLDKINSIIPHPIEVQLNFGYYLKRGRISYLTKQYSLSYFYFHETYKYALAGNHTNSKSISLYYLSSTALQLGYNEEAKKYAMQNLVLSENGNIKSGRINALINLSKYYNKTGNKNKAYELINEAMQLKDSLVMENNIKQVNVLGTIYEYGKQQKEIVSLQNEKKIQVATVKQKSTLNRIFIACIIFLLLLGYLGFMNIRKGQQLSKQQQKMQQQKIVELEKDQQFLAIDAMLKGQEEERSRIAKDLHDGLGSLLYGTKLSFMNLKETLNLSQENGVQLDKSLSMLDNTIGDFRKVAQNLMPEALVKFGLYEALKDFCDAIQYSSGIKVIYQQFGERRKLSNTAEVFIYRIIQELVNNAVKHADAEEIIVQVMMTNNKTGITVEDNGKGFYKNEPMNNKGAGLANIKYRVQYFNGTLDIVSSPSNGTSVNIELIV
jgi:two-component system, NarL family, sensor kinase